MSLSVDLSRYPSGWRLTPEPQIDLSHWQLDYHSDRIVCTPQPSDLVLMLLGTVVLYGFALVLLLVAVAPGWLGFSAPQRPGAASRAAEGKGQPAAREPVWSPEEARRIKEDVLQEATKNNSPEEKEKFLQNIEETTRQRKERAAVAASQRQPWFDAIVFAARLFALLPAALFALPGTLCLRRALMFFRDRVELSVRHGALVVQRPKLFGGEFIRTWPLSEIEGMVEYRVKYRVRRRTHDWLVAIVGTDDRRPYLRFLVEQTFGHGPATHRLSDFTEALARLTGRPFPGAPS